MYGWNGGGWSQGGYAQGFPWAGILVGLAVLAVIGLLVALSIRVLRGTPRLEGEKRGRSLEILTERFARGEIGAEEFRSMKAELENPPSVKPTT